METPVGGLLLIQVVLIAVNAFFAAAEIAVVSLSETKLRRQAEDGDKKAKKLLAMVMEPSGFLSTIQIAITLAGFLSSAFAADHFAGPLADADSFLFFPDFRGAGAQAGGHEEA